MAGSNDVLTRWCVVRSCDDAVEMNDARSSYGEDEWGVAQIA